MFYKINEVYPLDNMLLMVMFENGVRKKYNVKLAAKKWPEFEVLENNTIFNNVQVDIGGYGIVWSDELDLACNELWEHGIEVSQNKETA